MTVCEAYILHLKTSAKVKASRKSRTVLSCLTSAGSFAAPGFVGTLPPRFRLTLKKVKSDCFRRSLPIRTSENINAEDNISPFLSSENVRVEPRKGHGVFKLNLWKATRFRHGLPTDF